MAQRKKGDRRRSIEGEDADAERSPQAQFPAIARRTAGRSSLASSHNQIDDYGPLVDALEKKGTDFAKGLVTQLCNASAGPDKINARRLLFDLSVLKGMEPRDQLEVMHLAQMAEIHTAVTRTAGLLARADNLALFDSYQRALNQLARTYTAQFEAFKRYRAGSEAKVTLQQNVSVNEGGQAIVGNVSQAAPRPVSADSAYRAPAAPVLADARQTPMEIFDEPVRVPTLSGTKTRI